MEAIIIHALNRGVDKRIIFLDDQDYFRFIHNLFIFNNQENVANSTRFFNKNNQKQMSDIRCHSFEKERNPRKLLVKVHAFCLMPNHYHLLLSPLVENGIPKFMKKLNMGYAKYFNKKYKRSGALFQGKYKSVLIENEAHFIHIPYYIHLNPLDLATPEWRERKLKDINKALKFLENYRWSSHLDYTGKKNFPSVTQRDLFLDFFDGNQKYEKSIKKWIKEMDMENISDIALE